MRTFLLISLSFALGCAGLARGQSLVMVSGNGQVDQSQLLSAEPLVVEAKDASGKAAPGVAVSWKITAGSGTLVRPPATTDANGQSAVTFLATNVPGGESFFSSTVTATSASGSVSFVITTALLTLNGAEAAPPLVTLIAPPQNNLTLTAPTGSTIAGGVVVRVTAIAGPQSNTPVPNVGVRIENNLDPTAVPPAQCSGPNGLVLTDATGTATCNLQITGSPGTYQLTAEVGEYHRTSPFTLTITPGITCNFSLSSAGQTALASGGSGTVNVNTSPGCGWTATSNVSFIAVTSGASGTGDGTTGFSIAANTGAARTGTLTIAGQTYTVNQNAGTAGGGALAITTPPALTPGNSGSTYSVTLSASGGTPPYNWALMGTLPTGLTLNSSAGTISGTPTTPGVYGFTLTVTDNVGASQSQGFSITINPASTSGLAITNTSFPPGVVGQAYQQLLTSSGACVSPFSPSPAFRVSSGSLPPGLIIQTNVDLTRSIVGTPTVGGVSNFTLTATDACDFTASASFSITITSAGGPAQMSASIPSISFTVQAGSTNIPAVQTVMLTSTTSAVLNYTATVSTQTGANWLMIASGATGNTPGTITVGLVNFANLTPGPYAGAITIQSQAANSPFVVPVNLTVLTAPSLTVTPRSFTVTQIGSSGSTVTRQSVVVTSIPQVNFTASATTQTGGSWLTVDPATTQGFTPGQVIAVVNAAGLAAGQYLGTLSITPVGGTPQTVAVTLNVQAPAVIVATPAPLAFSFQQGDATPASQSLSLGSTGEALTLTIGVATESGNWLSVNPSTATTPANVSVSVDPTGLVPAIYKGTLNLSASDPSVAPLTVPVTLTVTKPVPVVGSITNAASFDPGPIAPGEMVTIFGSTLGPATPVSLELTASGTVATTLGGTQVFFDNTPAPMIYSSAGQISVIVPYEVAGQSMTALRVEYQDSLAIAQGIRVIASAPGVFVANASGQGAIINQDGSPNSAKNGAAPGSVVSIYATGEGQTDPAGMDGVLNATVLPLPKPHLAVTVQINGEAAEVTYYGGAPGQVAGLMQVNARVPADVPKGTSVPVTITVGAATSQAGVTLAIEK